MADGHYFEATPSAESRPGRSVVLRVGDRALSLATDRGVFGGGLSVIDRGTATLLKVAPVPNGGEVLDLGCGYGPIALWAAASAPSCRVWAVDVNERSLALCAANAAAAGLATQVFACAPDEVPADVTFDTIYSNPPIRVGKAALHELLLRWLARLSPAGSAWLVVQRHLGSDSLEAWLRSEGFAAVRVASKGGYRVLRVLNG